MSSTRQPAVAVVAAVALAGCGSEVSSNDALLKAFDQDPASAAARIRAMDDPVAREVAVLALVEARPGRTRMLCDALPAGPAHDRCVRYNERAHLWTNGVLAGRSPSPRRSKRPGPGPSTGRFYWGPAVENPWASIPAAPGDCTGPSATRSLCLVERAKASAVAGRFDDAAAACKAADSARARDDCFFTVAEVVSASGTSAGFAAGAKLCLGAGTLGPECDGHVLMGVRNASSRLGGDAELVRLVRGGRDVAAWWQQVAPELLPVAVDWYWANVWERLLIAPPDMLSRAAKVFPEVAQPHVRDAAAIRCVKQPDPVECAQQLLAGERRGPVGGLPRALREDLWRADFGSEDQIPAIFFIDPLNGRRPADPDPAVDLRLSVLEAVGRCDPARIDLLEATLADPTAPTVVRWSAVRILAQLAPDDPALEAARSDTDPRIRSRAAGLRAGAAKPDGGEGMRGAPLPADDPRVQAARHRQR